MTLPRTPWDPDGYYARLGVSPGAGPETITVAFRREARILHPDVAGTGNANAFVALKQAYDVLGHPQKRAAYDRKARQETAPEPEPGEIGPTPFPEMAVPPTRHPRLRDLPVAVWAGMAAVLMVGIIEIGLHLSSSPASPRRETIPALAREVPPAAANEPQQWSYGPAPVRLAGTPNFYVTPTSAPTVLWRADAATHAMVPWGQLAPFTAVQGLRLIKQNGMVEVKVTDMANGLIQADRLVPGDSAAAARAWCTYHAGPTPANGEVLIQSREGGSRLSIDNRSGQPAVVKLRSTGGAIVASVFIGPGGQATMEGLPDEPAWLDFATGEAWSRACHGFAAGMRAARLPTLVKAGALKQLTIPPAQAVAPIDISDQAFQQE